jgi:hypothetical protein
MAHGLQWIDAVLAEVVTVRQHSKPNWLYLFILSGIQQTRTAKRAQHLVGLTHSVMAISKKNKQEME